MKQHRGKILGIVVIIFIAILAWWIPSLHTERRNYPLPLTKAELQKPLPGIGNLPALPFSGVPFNKKMLFGYPNPEALMTALHKKTLLTLSEGQNLSPVVLQYALEAYACAVDQNLSPKQRYLTIIDYSLPATEPRFWVIDLRNGGVLFHTLVAHGKNSGFVDATNFSNSPNSLASSLGLFVTLNTYTGHNGYSLKLKGLEPGFNDMAEERDVVIHGAAYVSPDFIKKYHYLGRSWGCPALSKLISTPVINLIQQGSLVFAYYPAPTWLKQSKFLHCQVPLPWKW